MAGTPDAWLSPMLCGTIDGVPDPGDDWVMEPKFDGWRLLMWNTGRGVKTYGGRNASDYSGKLPYIEAIIAQLPADTALDGEIVGTDWGDVQGVMTRGNGPHVPTPGIPALTYVAFDILRCNGTDTRSLTWTERRALLEAGVQDSPHVKLTTPVAATERGHQVALALGFEGSVVKRRDGRYANGRSQSWLKIKPQETCEVKVTGFKPGEGKFQGLIGAIEFEMLSDAGRPSGVMSRASGMNDTVREEMTKAPENWVGEIIEIRHHGIMPSGKPRHPQFFRKRDDKTPAPAQRKAPSGNAPPRRAPSGGWVRNYTAMGDTKLLGACQDFDRGTGDAVNRVTAKGGDVDLNAAKCRAIARERGLI